MMPDLRALFPATRLLPGRGATIRGYGDKRTLVGVLAVGANGVITLQRAGKSGLLPSLVNAEAPVQLRAGPGVRIHGHGGIHTLERLPLPPPEEPTLGPARLEWEVEWSWGRVQVCTLGYESIVTPGNWVVAVAVTYNGTLGSYVERTTASGVITAYGPNDLTPDACATPSFNSTYNPETDYGDPTGSSEAETLISFASQAATALATMDVASLTTGSQAWARNVWEDVSREITPFTYSFGTVGMGYSGGGEVSADNYRFRLRNRGSVSLRVDCGFYGSGISGGATDIPAVIDLAPGATSAWQEVPSIDPDPAKYRSAQIRRVRIGRWRMIA